jgi:hypothetical protein
MTGRLTWGQVSHFNKFHSLPIVRLTLFHSNVLITRAARLRELAPPWQRFATRLSSIIWNPQ